MNARALSAPAATEIEHAVEADHAALVWRFRTLPGASARRDARGQHLSTRLHSGFFNNVMQAHYGVKEGPSLVGEAIAAARRAGRPWRFYVGSGSSRAGLSRRLAESGLRVGPSLRPMSAVLPSGVVFEAASLTVERVGDVSGLDAWLEVRCASLGWGAATVGAWRSAHEHLGFAQDAAVLSYIARRQGEPVGCLTLHIGDAAYDGTTTAGIYHVDTVPSARRSGVATTLTLHAMMEAERRGAERVLLSATSVARGMYARLGYVESGHLTFWFDEALGF